MLTRRNFLQIGAGSLAAASFVPWGTSPTIAAPATPAAPPRPLDPARPLPIVKLGNTGLLVSQIAFGTGVRGYNKGSDLTRLGMAEFTGLARHAYERGVRFYDMADSYGSQPFVGQAIKPFPREKLTLGSKIWTEDDSKKLFPQIPQTIDRILREIGTSYLDILLMHCLLSPGWSEKRQRTIAEFQRAKQAGKVRAIGISAHNWDALVEAVETPWVDVILARINPFGTLMDNKPAKVKAVLQKAIAAGKGVIAMKVFGEGKRVKDDEREASIRYVLREVGVPCMTLGMTTKAQVDDAVERVSRLSPA
jgi:predicted aldo/keto reductase-like oxidoreductase